MAQMTSLPTKHHQASRGSAVMLVLAMTVVVTAQLMVMGLLTSRSTAQEAALSSNTQLVDQALTTAVTQFKQDMMTYAAANGYTLARGGFEHGLPSSYINRTFSLTDPETSTTTTGNVLVDAYVDVVRPPYYRVHATANYSGISRVNNEWVLIRPAEEVVIH